MIIVYLVDRISWLLVLSFRMQIKNTYGHAEKLHSRNFAPSISFMQESFTRQEEVPVYVDRKEITKVKLYEVYCVILSLIFSSFHQFSFAGKEEDNVLLLGQERGRDILFQLVKLYFFVNIVIWTLNSDIA